MLDQAFSGADTKSRKSCLYAIFPAASLICAVLFFMTSSFTHEVYIKSLSHNEEFDFD